MASSLQYGDLHAYDELHSHVCVLQRHGRPVEHYHSMHSIPVSFTRILNISKGQKIGLVGIFGLGILYVPVTKPP